MIADPARRAQQLADAGRPAEGATLLAQAGAAGDAAALHELALWHLYGNRIARDLAAARATLRRAVAAGSREAALLEVALTATGSGGPADFAGALALLRAAAMHDTDAAAQLALVTRMTLTDAGDPVDRPHATVLGHAPTVRHVAGLLSQDECRHVAIVATPMLAPATVVDPRTGRNVVNPVRTSDTAVLGPQHETLVIHALNRRIAAASGTDWRAGEALTILRYRPGQQFRPHIDAIAGSRNQRVRTVLVYLNDGYAGGETLFSTSGLSVRGQAGDAIFFDNVGPDGAIDRTAQHAGAVLTRGEKWLATRWIRARPYDPWRGGPEGG